MRYKFNNFTGRLSAPSPLDTPSKFGRYTEGPTIQYMLGTKISVTDHQPVRRGNYGAVPEALQRKMRIFQFPNNLPVHLKGGPTDKILYGITAALCLVGLLECFRVYYVLSFPQPPQQD